MRDRLTFTCKLDRNHHVLHSIANSHRVEPRFDEVLDEQAKLDALSAYTSKGGEGVEAEVTVKAKGNTLVNFRNILRKGGVDRKSVV